MSINAQGTETILITRKPRRPDGIPFLAGLLFIFGVVFSVMLILSFGKITDLSNDQIFFSKYQIIFSLALRALLMIMAGIGLWRGKTWGWWLCAFYFVLSMQGGLNQFLFMISSPEISESAKAYYHYARILSKIFWGIVFLYYLFKKNVLKYYALNDRSRLKLLGVLVGEFIGLVLFGFLMDFLFGPAL